MQAHHWVKSFPLLPRTERRDIQASAQTSLISVVVVLCYTNRPLGLAQEVPKGSTPKLAAHTVSETVSNSPVQLDTIPSR